MHRKDKIQHLLISHLLEEGNIQLVLPDGMTVELGILKEDKHGDLRKTNNYCWLIASQRDREVSMDSYNLGLRFNEDNGKILFDESEVDNDGSNMRIFNVI
jgi:hypothetical protein